MKKLLLTPIILFAGAAGAQETAAPPATNHQELQLTVNPFSSKLLELNEYKLTRELEQERLKAYKHRPGAASPGNAASPATDPQEMESLKVRVNFLEQEVKILQENPPIPESIDYRPAPEYQEPSANPQPAPAPRPEAPARQTFTAPENLYVGVGQNVEGEFKETHNPNVVYRGIVSLGTQKKLSFFDKINNRGGLAAVGDLVPKPFVTEDPAENKMAKINEITDDYAIIGFKKIIFTNELYTNHHIDN